jgi:hypothetical protein
MSRYGSGHKYLIAVTAPIIALLIGACDQRSAHAVDQKEHKTAFMCPRDGKTRTQKELVDMGVSEFIRHRNPHACRQYKSIAEFYAVNPNCCDLSLEITTIDKDGDGTLEPPSSFGQSAARGRPIGMLRIKYICGVPDDTYGGRIGVRVNLF